MRASQPPSVEGANTVDAATLEVSYEEGTTWQRAELIPERAGSWSATVRIPARVSHPSLRATASDDAGNRVTQEVVRVRCGGTLRRQESNASTFARPPVTRINEIQPSVSSSLGWCVGDDVPPAGGRISEIPGVEDHAAAVLEAMAPWVGGQRLPNFTFTPEEYVNARDEVTLARLRRAVRTYDPDGVLTIGGVLP
jgi:hypothetical protein